MKSTHGFILSPIIDTLFCCGGLLWIIFAVQYIAQGAASIAPSTGAILVSSIIGTIFLSETHTAASLVQIYSDNSTERNASFFMRKALIAFGILSLTCLAIKDIVPLLTKVYLLVVAQHFTAQSYGLILLYCMKNNYFLGTKQKLIIKLLMQTTMAFSVLQQLTFKEWSADKFLNQTLPQWTLLPQIFFDLSVVALAIAIIAFICLLVHKFMTEKKLFPLPAFLLTVTSVAIFICSKDIAGTLWLYVPAFFHGSQYLVVTIAKHLRSSQQSTEKQSMLSVVGNYYIQLVVIALLIYVCIPNLLTNMGINTSLAFSSVFLAINLHHILTDHFIWKLRKPEVRQALV